MLLGQAVNLFRMALISTARFGRLDGHRLGQVPDNVHDSSGNVLYVPVPNTGRIHLHWSQRIFEVPHGTQLMVAEIFRMEIQFWLICHLPSLRKIGSEIVWETICFAAHTFSQVEMQISVSIVKNAVNLILPTVSLSRVRIELEYVFTVRLLIAGDFSR